MGRVRYWVFGPEDGTKVVLIHGLSVPAITWKDVAPPLASKGYRVLTYDLYGKGYSEAPQTTYDTNLFVTQLALLMQYVHWEHANIVGFSMGGGIAAAFAATFPQLVESKVVLISSGGVIERSASTGTDSQTPSSHPNPIPSMIELRELQAKYLPGYESAIVSCVKDGPLRGLQSSFDRLGRPESHWDVLIIHGTADNTVPFKYAEAIKARIPSASQVTLEEAGHDLLVVSPHSETVVESLVKFIG